MDPVGRKVVCPLFPAKKALSLIDEYAKAMRGDKQERSAFLATVSDLKAILLKVTSLLCAVEVLVFWVLCDSGHLRSQPTDFI